MLCFLLCSLPAAPPVSTALGLLLPHTASCQAVVVELVAKASLVRTLGGALRLGVAAVHRTGKNQMKIEY